ncbi:MAG: nuclear transport factor 2 family protein [Acidiferrobacter sp.]
MSVTVAEDMLAALARTANVRDHSAHMALISPTVNVFGVPNFAVIGYDDWARQCQHEFAQGLLKRVSYEGLHVISMTSTNILFKTIETVEGTDDTKNRYGLEVLIRREDDGVWRVVQERILADDEMEFDRHKSR